MIPGLRDVGATREVLPYGRYLATLEEVEGEYVPEGDENRRKIWDAFLEVVSVARQVYGRLVAVWIGGSFVTSEPSPHDIDVVLLVRDENYRSAVSDQRGRFVTGMLLGAPGFPALSDLVDAYLLPVPPTECERVKGYSESRGYWDQFWSKARFEDGDDRWLYPAAGYLEVIIDGYDAKP
ncbi:DUF6932 family protein [Caniella muris]|uniref:DUF6932 family protein n=1 Tax=Caniella muris TaxID=2941502 RepID=UPI00203E0832|nr:hypothetical protein [Caniella muris]